jgi:glycosyltransferase involved in cell wall biosynthesis
VRDRDRFQRGSDRDGPPGGRPFTVGLVPDFPMVLPAKGGIDVYSLALISALSKVKPRCRFVVFISEAHRGLLADLGGQFTTVPVRVIARNNLQSICWHLFALPALARKRGVDLLHFFGGNRRLGPYPWGKAMATVHDLHQHDSLELYGPLRFLYYRCLVAPLLKRQTHIIAVSRSTACDVEKRLGIPSTRISTVANGFDQGRFRAVDAGAAGWKALAKYSLHGEFLLYVSALEHPRKNHVNLVRAYERLRGTLDVPGNLVFAGADSRSSETIRGEIARTGQGEAIKVLGAIPDEDLVALYGTARAFVHPSTHEGFGIPLLEAMACGLPVACSDIPAFREVAGDAAVFFDPRDPARIAEAITKLCRDQGKREEYRLRGLARASLFSWERTATRVADLYEQILSSTFPIIR